MNTNQTTQFNEHLNRACPGMYLIDGKPVEFSVLLMELGSWDDMFALWKQVNKGQSCSISN